MNAYEIAKKIKNHGFKVFFVGGFVRDALLKMDSHDIDITTNAKYEELVNIFTPLEAKINVVGANFKVLMIDDVEVATLRYDNYDENDNIISVTEAPSIVDDLARRDLTINSMAIDPINVNMISGYSLIDPFSGKDDLKHKIIRFTGDAKKRIREDPIRMLRACRFLATIDGARFATDTFLAIKHYARFILNIPTERIRLEIIKAMKAKNAGNFFRALNNTGLLVYIFPNMVKTVNHDGGRYHNESVFEHSVLACDEIIVNKPLLKIAAFLHDIGKPLAYNLMSNGSFKGHAKFGAELAEKELRYLKFSNEEVLYITSLIKLHMNNFDKDSGDRTTRRLLIKLKDLQIHHKDFISLTIADHDANMKKTKHCVAMFDILARKFSTEIDKKNAFSIKDLAIDGNDIIEQLNIEPSPEVGKMLKKLFNIVVENPKENTKDRLIEIMRGIDHIL